MIKKNLQYGKTEDVTVLYFGNGNISMVAGNSDKTPVLLLKSHTKREIGSTEKHGHIDSDGYTPEIAIHFSNIESLHALLDSLDEVRSIFISQDRTISPVYFPGEEQRTEHNANVIGAFMDHYKDLTGLEIPEEVYESFFNA